MHGKWTKHLPYLEKNVGSKDIHDIAQELDVDYNELHLFLHRSRRFKLQKQDNIVLRLLTVKFTYPEYFMPTKQFYQCTGIKQGRWWQLYRGEKKPTGKECAAIVKHLKVSDKEVQGWLQLDLFDNVL